MRRAACDLLQYIQAAPASQPTTQRGFAHVAGAAAMAVDCIVIGAGVVGLACARALALLGREVVILEKHASFGTETSSRHSEGIYYPHGSLKAQLCVEGKHRLYQFAREHGVAHSNLGKLIVATSEAQVPKLHALLASAKAAGVRDLRLLSGAEACAMEGALSCVAALHSPSTGILDSHGFMQALLAGAQQRGALLAVNTEALAARREAGSRRLVVLAQDVGGEAGELAAQWVVNASGLHAPSVAAQCFGTLLPPGAIPRQRLAKGNYFSLAGSAPFTRLIYPIPEDGGLGVHLTLDLAGAARFGPDVEWLPEACSAADIDYSVDPGRSACFYPEVRRYWPDLADGVLQPSYSGVRPKLAGPHDAAADFVLQGPEQHGVEGLVNLFGIESPGLTSSLAIAERVVAMLQGCRSSGAAGA